MIFQSNLELLFINYVRAISYGQTDNPDIFSGLGLAYRKAGSHDKS